MIVSGAPVAAGEEGEEAGLPFECGVMALHASLCQHGGEKPAWAAKPSRTARSAESGKVLNSDE